MNVAHLNPTLQQDRNGPRDEGNWRQVRTYFRNDDPGLLAVPGLVTVGIRQDQGHEVSSLLCLNVRSFQG